MTHLLIGGEDDSLMTGSSPSRYGNHALGAREVLDVTTLRTLVVAYVRRRIQQAEIKANTGVEHRAILWNFVEAAGEQRLSETAVKGWWATTTRLAPDTRRNRLSIVKGFIDWLVAEGHCPRNVATGIKPPKSPRRIHRALNGQAPLLLAHADDQRTRLVIILGLQAGLRRAEIAHLQVGDINWGDETLFIVGKGDHERFVPITAELGRELRAYLSQYPITAGPLIRRLDGRGGITPRRIGDLVVEVALRAGIKKAPRDGVSTHALRHTAATDVANREEDLRVVQELLGHAHLSTTEIYIGKLPSKKLRRAVEGRCYTCGPRKCRCGP